MKILDLFVFLVGVPGVGRRHQIRIETWHDEASLNGRGIMDSTYDNLSVE